MRRRLSVCLAALCLWATWGVSARAALPSPGTAHELAYELILSAESGQTSYTYAPGYPLREGSGDLDLVMALLESGHADSLKEIAVLTKTRGGQTLEHEVRLTMHAPERSAQARETARAAADSVLTPGMTDREKYRALFDWIVLNTTYDLGAADGGQTAASLFLDGRSVCNGYAKAYLLLCELAGLPCLYVSGEGYNHKGWGPHAWNMIRLDGEWLCVDATFGDPDRGERIREEYFAAAEDVFHVEHRPNYPDDLPKIRALLYPDAAAVPTAPVTEVPVPPAAPVTAAPSKSYAVLVDGAVVEFEAYLIDGSNYFKLRDLAYALNGSLKQFNVGYNAPTETVTLSPGFRYRPVGGEMGPPAAAPASAVPSPQRVVMNGQPVSFTAYNIQGSNFFKLRDLGAALDFGVSYDPLSGRVSIDTRANYIAA